MKEGDLYMGAYKKDKEFMELVGHLIEHPVSKLDNITQHHSIWSIRYRCATSYKIAKNWAGMKNLQRVVVFARFFLRWRETSLTKDMLGFIQEYRSCARKLTTL